MSATSPLAPTAAPLVDDLPYRGIEPFRYKDHVIFCGRKKENRELVQSITIYRGFLLYGDSGAGKSSLVNAGVIPQLREEGFLPHRIRVRPTEGSELLVERIETREPDGSTGFLPSLFPVTDPKAPQLSVSVEALSQSLEAARERANTPTPVLIFDQFEEIVTLFEQSNQSDWELRKRVQARIIKVVIALLRDQALRVKLLFVFREDYFGKVWRLLTDFPKLSDHYLRIEPLRTSDLDEIILGPLKAGSYSYEAKFTGRVVEQLKKQLSARAQDELLNMSEAQIACLRLWQSADPAWYLTERGVRGLLEDYLKQALEGLSKKQRDLATALLGALITPSGTRNVVSKSTLLKSVSLAENVREEALARVLESLETGTKVVQYEARNDERYYELVSEFLIAWILAQDTKRKSRRKVYKVIVLCGAVLAVILAMAIVWLWRLNEQAYQELIVQKVVAEREEAESQLVKARAESERLKALNAEVDKNLGESQRRVRTLEAAIERVEEDLRKSNEVFKKELEKVIKSEELARKNEEEARKAEEEARKSKEQLERLLDSKRAIKAPKPDNSRQVQKPGSNPDLLQEQLQR